jgi:amidase
MTTTVVAAADAVRRGERTARELTEQALARITEREPDVHAFRTVCTEQALAAADLIDGRPDRADLPLAGVPIAVKDNVAVAGEYIGNGTLADARTVQPEDHPVVGRLRAAGAVIVGLTTVPELCVFGTTDSVASGITRNPWQLDRTPGGSSGGSAAAVAAGMVPAAHGNDGMGSIRIPAACTGLVGLKPGLGIVPAQLGNGSWLDMAENGPLTTTVADCALLLSVLADRPELASPQLDPGTRIGVSVHAPLTGLPVDRHYAAAARETGRLLAEAGHPVREAELRYPAKAGPAALARWFAGAEGDVRLLANPGALDRRVARHARLGRLVRATGGPRPAGRNSWQRAAARYFEQVDVLVTPMLAQLPPAAIAWHAKSWSANLVSNIRYAPFAAPWNLAGWPAMAVPAGLHPGGLPLSVQLVGRPGSEATLLAVASRLEQLRPWQRIAPSYAGTGTAE